MPTLLAIETSTDSCSVAICHNKVIQESFVIRPREHNKIVLTMVDDLLKGLHLTCFDLDAIAFGAGPGSFTGLRLSAGIAQGLAFAAHKPVIAISSLAALALSAAEQINANTPQTLLTVIDARMQDVYFGAYQYQPSASQESFVVALGEDKLLPISQLSKQLENYNDAVIINNGCPADFVHLSTSQHHMTCYPHARAVLALAKIQFHAGKTLTAEQALPVYLRESISWQKWQPKSSLKISANSSE